MRKTLFAGLTVLDEDESVVQDGGAFIGHDRDIIDHFLELGAKTHRHDARAGLPNPEGAPSAAILSSAGTLPADATYTIGFTLEDDSNGETIISPTVTVSTPPAMDPPEQSIGAEVDYDGGELLVDTYYYAISWVDAEGGETPIGPSTAAEIEPGFPNAEVTLSGLITGMATASAAGWRLYRAVGGGDFGYLASGTIDSFVDMGSASPNCDITPIPDDVNSTLSVNRLQVDLPPSDALGVGSATFINMYLSEDGEFVGDVLLEQFPVSSAGQSAIYTALDLGDAQPPDVSTTVGGASKIDPDTELLDWHWKRPVATRADLGSGELGDARLVEIDGTIWGMLESPSGTVDDWQVVGGASAGVGPGPGSPYPIGLLDFFGASGVQVVVASAAGERVNVTIGAQVGSASGSVHQVTDLDGPLLEGIEQLQFGGSGGASVGVELDPINPKKARVTMSALGGGSGGTMRSVEDADGPVVWGASALKFVASGSAIVGVTDGGGGSALVTIFASATAGPQGAIGPQGIQGIQGIQGVQGDPGPQGVPGIGGDGIAKVRASGETTGPFDAPSGTTFAASGALGVHAQDLGGGSAEVLFAPHGRMWASAMAPALGSGASAAFSFAPSAAGGRLLKVSTNKRARVKVFGASGYEPADRTRAIGTDPSGDHGVLLDYAMTSRPSGGIGALSPTVDAHNLDGDTLIGNMLYLNVTNYDATGDVIVAFLYIPTEIV